MYTATKVNYYNEHDIKTAQWLQALIDQKLIPQGHVDTRSIVEVTPNDLRNYTQCHFFAGIGGWSLALQLAGIPATTRLWTGSCPCQPFSTAGKGLAQADERHLWPVFFELIRQCSPPVVFGEQVASAAVVGRSDKNKSVQSVRDRQTLLRILQELKRGTAGNLQGLCEEGRTSAEAEQSRDGKGRLQKMAGRETWLCSCECGKAQSQEFWDTFRPIGREHSGTDRQRSLRSDGDSFRPSDSALLERAIVGSNHTQSGLYYEEYPSGLICLECHGELLGVTEDCGSVERDSRIEERSIQQIIGLNRGEATGTPEKSWLDGISADLEAEGYACGATVLGAHSVGAPHIRQRLYWVAYSNGKQELATDTLGLYAELGSGSSNSDWQRVIHSRECDEFGNCPVCEIDYSECGCPGPTQDDEYEYRERDGILEARRLGNTEQPRLEGFSGTINERSKPGWIGQDENGSTVTAGVWTDYRLAKCRDGKTRRIPTEPAFFPLAHGIPARVVRLRGYGNAIVPALASEFIKAFYETQEDEDFC